MADDDREQDQQDQQDQQQQEGQQDEANPFANQEEDALEPEEEDGSSSLRA